MSHVEEFLTAAEEQEIIEAIRIAETNTSGEIRVHIEKSASIAHFDRALEVFQLLRMHETKLQNGVLIYLAIDDQQFVICGDKRINDVVPDTFWDTTRDTMLQQFKIRNFKQGLIDGIRLAGEKLQHYFPYEDGDTDELSNEISKG